MIELIVLILRALQFLLALIVLGLSGHLASYALSPSQVNFMIFVAVWTMLVLIYLALAPKFFAQFANVFAILALDALCMLFWFAGFIALAVWYHRIGQAAGDIFFSGCGALGDYCGVNQAAVVFGAFEWALFLATTIIALLGLSGNRKHNPTAPGATA